jgi:prophage antirepressor-like protein
MNKLMIFENKRVEVLEFNGNILFNPKHVAECLDIKNINDAIANFNEKQKIKLRNLDIANTDIRKLNNAGENFLTESGVYKLIFKSRKEEAERFQDWVTDEVLPSIRQTGVYEVKGLSKELQAIFAIDKKQQQMEVKVDYLYNHMTIDYEQQENLNQLARSRAVDLLGWKTSQAYKRVSKKLFSELWRDYKRYFGVNSYKNTARKEYENAREYLIKWSPSTNLRIEIEAINGQFSFVE